MRKNMAVLGLALVLTAAVIGIAPVLERLTSVQGAALSWGGFAAAMVVLGVLIYAICSAVGRLGLRPGVPTPGLGREGPAAAVAPTRDYTEEEKEKFKQEFRATKARCRNAILATLGWPLVVLVLVKVGHLARLEPWYLPVALIVAPVIAMVFFVSHMGRCPACGCIVASGEGASWPSTCPNCKIDLV